MLKARGEAEVYADRLLVREDNRIIFVKVDEIDYISSSRNYIVLHCGPHTTHVMRETLTCVLKRLNPRHFIRVHRCTVVNLERIQEMYPWFNGEYKIVLTTGESLVMSRSYHEQFLKEFGPPL